MFGEIGNTLDVLSLAYEIDFGKLVRAEQDRVTAVLFRGLDAYAEAGESLAQAPLAVAIGKATAFVDFAHRDAGVVDNGGQGGGHGTRTGMIVFGRRIIAQRLSRGREALAQAAASLNAMSPLRVLERGYAIAKIGGRAVVKAKDLKVGATVELRFREGWAEAKIITVKQD